MKKFLLTAAVTLLATGSALAAKTTVEFKRDSGETNVVVLDGEGGAMLPNGAKTTYTYDADALKLCFATPDGDNCIVLAEQRPEGSGVGYSTRYTAADGAEGTATIIAIEE